MKRLIAFLTGIFLIVQLNGQGAKYIVQNYDLMNEISLNGSVWCMVQDTTGLLYFGADYGIVTYDGTSWKLSSKDQSMVRSLMTDSGHRIFYGGFDDFGILEPNPATGLNFRSLVGDLPDSLRVFGDIWSINECDGKIFFQSRNRIFILGQGGVISAAVNDTYHRGFVMNGKYTVNQKGIGLTFFDGTGFKLLAGGEYFEKMVISSMIGLSDNLLLIGTRNNGAFRYNTVEGTISQPFPGFPETNSLLIRNNIYHGILLPDGTLAVGTLYGGTLIMSTDGKILKVLNSQHGLRDNANYHLSVTSDYNLWICTSNGISAYNINSPFILWDYTTGIDGVILDIEDFENSIFIGSLIGLYEIQTDKFSPDPIRTNARCLLNMEVWDIRQIRHSGRDYLFLGTGKGLFRLDGHVPVRVRESGTVLKVLQSRSDPDLILAMRSDELDIYRWKGAGLVYQGTLINLYNGLRTAVEDGKGFLWIGTRKSGVVRIAVSDLERAMNGAQRAVDFNALNLSRRNFTFNSILTDALEFQGQCLFSNSTGLYQFDYSRQDFEKCNLFGPEIMEYGKMISTLNKDSHGNIWVGGEDIFVRRPDGTYTLDKLNFKQLKDIFSAFVFLHNPDQKTWIGGNSGLYLYDNSIRMKPPATLQTLITKIVINSDSTLYINAPNLDWLKPKKYASGKNNPLKIDLDKSNSKVTFCYSLPFFDSEKRTVYSYLLEGYSDKWSEWSGETSLTFSNLKPRTYCFRVISRTIYNQVGKTAEVYFTVPRRWYYSEYAIAGYLVIFVLMVYRIAGYLSKNKIKKHLRIEDVIQKRIQESKRSQILSLIKTQMAADDQAGGQPADGFQTVPEGHQFLTKALKTLELHMSDHQFTAGMFCREMGMSQSRVYRKLLSLTGMSINEFIRNIRLKKAAQLLVESDHSISEIAYMTGFGSPGYFSKCFKAEFGMNPRDFAPNRKKE